MPGETSEDGPIPKTTCDAIVASVGARVVACVLLGGEQDTYALRPAHPDWNDSLMSPDVNLAGEHNPKRKAHEEKRDSDVEPGHRDWRGSVANEERSYQERNRPDAVRSYAFAESVAQDRVGEAVVLAEGSNEAGT